MGTQQASRPSLARSAEPLHREIHCRPPLGVEDANAPDWYLNEAADQHWSTRQLERQRRELNHIHLLTPNEGLFQQHLCALRTAGVSW